MGHAQHFCSLLIESQELRCHSTPNLQSLQESWSAEQKYMLSGGRMVPTVTLHCGMRIVGASYIQISVVLLRSFYNHRHILFFALIVVLFLKQRLVPFAASGNRLKD